MVTFCDFASLIASCQHIICNACLFYTLLATGMHFSKLTELSVIKIIITIVTIIIIIII